MLNRWRAGRTGGLVRGICGSGHPSEGPGDLWRGGEQEQMKVWCGVPCVLVTSVMSTSDVTSCTGGSGMSGVQPQALVLSGHTSWVTEAADWVMGQGLHVGGS